MTIRLRLIMIINKEIRKKKTEGRTKKRKKRGITWLLGSQRQVIT